MTRLSPLRRRGPRRTAEGADRGVSLIEILVAITLMGTLGVSVLAALQVTIIGSRLERDHARAHQWLQSSTEVLVNDIDWKSCDTYSASWLQDYYQTELRSSSALVPEGFVATDLEIPVLVEFAGPDNIYGSVCAAVEDRQRVTIQVRNDDGDVVESVQVVKVP
jgi:prepilin-type N-terminal cleavage/methylation domain-containing protein